MQGGTRRGELNMGTIHRGKEDSHRLQQVLKALQGDGVYTIRELREVSGIESVGTAMSELRTYGHNIKRTYVDGYNRYTLLPF